MLPPLRDVINKPEVGDALRNKLVRLMTHIDTDVKNCSSEFLFVLCKESGETDISANGNWGQFSCIVLIYKLLIVFLFMN